MYPDVIAADVSEERLRRYFTKEHRGYRVRREAARDGAVRVARCAEGLAFFAAGSGLMPQPADLPEPRGAARVFDILHFSLRAEGAAVPRSFRSRR